MAPRGVAILVIDENADSLQAQGMQGWVLKPVAVEELAATLARVLQKQSPGV